MPKVALVAMSDPRRAKDITAINKLTAILTQADIQVFTSPLLSIDDPQAKGRELSHLFNDPQIDYIFDVSGGNLANLSLNHIDFRSIHSAKYFGYSDNTTIINAIYSQTGIGSTLFQILNILNTPDLKTDVINFIHKRHNNLYVHPVQGKVLGGNLRCLLKLAGTPYLPDFQGQNLLIEAYGGNQEFITSLLAQAEQLKIFQNIETLILGQFTELQNHNIDVSSLSQRFWSGATIKAAAIGHQADAKAIFIG